MSVGAEIEESTEGTSKEEDDCLGHQDGIQHKRRERGCLPNTDGIGTSDEKQLSLNDKHPPRPDIDVNENSVIIRRARIKRFIEVIFDESDEEINSIINDRKFDFKSYQVVEGSLRSEIRKLSRKLFSQREASSPYVMALVGFCKDLETNLSRDSGYCRDELIQIILDVIMDTNFDPGQPRYLRLSCTLL